jgi:hypothetical protein
VSALHLAYAGIALGVAVLGLALTLGARWVLGDRPGPWRDEGNGVRVRSLGRVKDAPEIGSAPCWKCGAPAQGVVRRVVDRDEWLHFCPRHVGATIERLKR